MQRRYRLPLIILSIFALAGSAFALSTGGSADPNAVATRADVVMMIVYIVLAVFVSFLCSVAEAVLLSVTPSYVRNLEREGHKAGPLLGILKSNVDRPLAAILTLNTIAHTFGAGGAGAKAELVFGSKWFGVSMIVLTLLILFASEIIPKTIGAIYWKKLAPVTARVLFFLIFILTPFIFLSEQLTRLLSRGKTHSTFSREEFGALAEIGEQEGHLKEEESRIVRNLLSLREKTAEEIMTPRTVMFALQRDLSVDEVYNNPEKIPYSRIPLFGADSDDITGFFLYKDLLKKQASDKQTTKLHEIERSLKAVPNTIKLSDLFEKFLDDREHLYLVVGEYGGTSGIVALEDVVETLLGEEIVDEADHHEDLQQVARDQALGKSNSDSNPSDL